LYVLFRAVIVRSIPAAADFFFLVLFLFVEGGGNVDNALARECGIRPAGPCGMIGEEAEVSTPEGILKPVGEIFPASSLQRPPFKTEHYLGIGARIRKAGQVASTMVQL